MVETGHFKDIGLQQNENIQSALLTAIARSAEDLTNGKGWPDGVNDLLESLGKITGVSRAWIFQTLDFSDKFILQDYTFEWASKEKYVQIGLPSFNKFETKIKNPDYKIMVESRVQGDYQKMIVSKLKPSENKTNLENQNVKSMLTIPIFVENRWWGTLGFDDCEREYNWSDIEIALLRTSGFLISSAILKDKLNAKRKQLDILKNITEYSAWEFDLSRKYVWCTSEILGTYTKKTNHLQFSLKSMLKMVYHKDRKKLIQSLKTYLKKSTNSKYRQDIRIQVKSATYRWIELIGTINNDTKDKLIGVAIDISKRKKAENKLEKEATTDPLTGILNRRKLDQIMSQERSNIFSFLMLDIDFFKKINDTYGHPVGDKIIIQVVGICKKYLRKNDYFARVGGEEFAILLMNIEKEKAITIANRIRQKIANSQFNNKKEPVSCTISIGCIYNNNQSKDITQIYKLADLALYKAKESGRNIVCSS